MAFCMNCLEQPEYCLCEKIALTKSDPEIMNDGGPAFPSVGAGAFADGLSVREWFAGHAMAALIVSEPVMVPILRKHKDDSGHDAVASEAVRFADALMRKLKPSEN